MEKFAWFAEMSETPRGLLLATGAGFCTMRPHAQAYATVEELRREEKPGVLGSATALLTLGAPGKEPMFVLLERDAAAPVDPLCWQFPAGRISPEELPLITACREVTEEVRLEQHCKPLGYGEVAIRLGPKRVEYLTQDAVHEFKARYVFHANTVEFYYPMSLELETLELLQSVAQGSAPHLT